MPEFSAQIDLPRAGLNKRSRNRHQLIRQIRLNLSLIERLPINPFPFDACRLTVPNGFPAVPETCAVAVIAPEYSALACPASATRSATSPLLIVRSAFTASRGNSFHALSSGRC